MPNTIIFATKPGKHFDARQAGGDYDTLYESLCVCADPTTLPPTTSTIVAEATAKSNSGITSESIGIIVGGVVGGLVVLGLVIFAFCWVRSKNNDMGNWRPEALRQSQSKKGAAVTVYEPAEAFKMGLYTKNSIASERSKAGTLKVKDAEENTAGYVSRADIARQMAFSADSFTDEVSKTNPKDWTSIQCLEWLTEKGFKDFHERYCQ